MLIDKSHGELGDGNVLMASGSLRAGGKSPKTDAKELYDFVMSEGLATPISSRPGRKLAAAPSSGYRARCGCRDRRDRTGRIWLNQKSEISYGPVYKKDVGGRALTSLKKRFLNLGGNYLNGSEGVRLIVENGCVTGLIAKRTAQRSNCALARRFLPPVASAPTRSWSRNTSAPTPTDASCAVPNKTPATACAWR